MAERMKELMKWLGGGQSPWHTVEMAAHWLEERGFEALSLNRPFSVKRGGRYYVENGTFLAAVTVGQKDVIRIAAAHTDWPCMRVKPQPELISGGCCRLSVEPYGGAILNTWLDRPLGLAGVVLLRTDAPMKPERRLISWDKPLLVIPNVAIHMNREVNKGVPYKANVDMLPICRTVQGEFEKNGYLVRQIAERLQVQPEDVLSFELCAYCCDEPTLLGFEEDLLTSPRLDNLSSVHACLQGLADAQGDGINVAVLYDNEEIGSNTRRGADSSTLTVILEKLALSLGLDRGALLDACLNGMLLSCDAAHAVHPNHPEKHDPVCRPVLNGGPVLKVAAGQSYMTQSSDCAVYQSICEDLHIPVQKFVNRSDMRGGSTLGPAMAANFPCRILDMGIPLLAMHSARELMGVHDFKFTKSSFIGFYNL